MLRRKITSLVLALAAVTAFAACGDGGNGAAEETETSAATGGDTGGDTGGNGKGDKSEKPGGGGLTVELVDNKIKAPKTAKVGDKVTVNNTGKAPHNWTSEKGDFATKAQIPAGGSDTVTLKKAGTFDYVCTLHPNEMKGSITVKK